MKPTTGTIAWYEEKELAGFSKLQLLKIKRAKKFDLEECDCDWSGSCFWHSWSGEDIEILFKEIERLEDEKR